MNDTEQSVTSLHTPFTIFLDGEAPSGSRSDVDLTATFTHSSGVTRRVRGFFAGGLTYEIRFLPELEGQWSYTTESSCVLPRTGSFTCLRAEANVHGVVRADGLRFRHADGTSYAPFGTTAYAWTHQATSTIDETLRTLSLSPFNKVRMCVFPKSMVYNTDEPELFPFERDAIGRWDVHRPDLEFWASLESRIRQLGELGIQSDLILFHPYDRWGLSTLSHEENLVYLDYCVRRLGAEPNIWWSLANEFDMLFHVSKEQWEEYGAFLSERDPFDHLLSVHNWLGFFDFTRPWVTHCSIQSSAIHLTAQWREEYGKPVVNDECRYEGDIEETWGNLSGFELVHRFWATVLKGAFCTHGETFYREDEVIWWAKGGNLRGESPSRIGFLRDLIEELGSTLEPVRESFSANPNDAAQNLPEHHRESPHVQALLKLGPVEWDQFLTGIAHYQAWAGDHALVTYLGHSCQGVVHIDLPEDTSWTVEIVDVWEMTREPLPETHSGRARIPLPGRPGIAVIAKRRTSS